MDPLERLKDLAISDRGFVFDPHTGASYSLNPTGLVVLRGLRDGLTRDQLVEAVRSGFAVNGADLGRDVDEFVRMLVGQGIVPRAFHA
jgi:hypothetical protein